VRESVREGGIAADDPVARRQHLLADCANRPVFGTERKAAAVRWAEGDGQRQSIPARRSTAIAIDKIEPLQAAQ